MYLGLSLFNIPGRYHDWEIENIEGLNRDTERLYKKLGSSKLKIKKFKLKTFD